jgi:anti-anti-sigma factor
MTSAPITIDVVPVEDCVVVAVAGEVDLLTADQLRDALMGVVERYAVVVVDLAEVQFLSSTGLAALTLAHRVAVASGNQLRLVATDRVTLRPLEITGMTTQIAVFDSTDDAMAGGDRPDPSSPRD